MNLFVFYSNSIIILVLLCAQLFTSTSAVVSVGMGTQYGEDGEPDTELLKSMGTTETCVSNYSRMPGVL